MNAKKETERIKRTVADSRTEQVHIIRTTHLNASRRLFGGVLMQWLDEVAGVVAMRHAGTKRVTTASVDNLQFKEGTYEGDLLVIIGYVTYVGTSSMEIEVDTYTEHMDGMRHLVNRAFFVMVALGEDNQPCQVPMLEITTEEEQARYEAGILRRQMRNQRRQEGY